MTDGVNEQKLKLAGERKAPDVLRTPEQESIETAPELSGEKRGHTPAAEAPGKLAELMNLRRRPKPTAIPQVRDEMTVRVEKILEEGIGDAYARLSPVAKQEFKIKGEQTAFKIAQLLKATHVKVKKILQLILEWLKLLPGVNRFFLEQEAKIKTDRIVALHKKQRG